jgi:hypothetical protein
MADQRRSSGNRSTEAQDPGAFVGRLPERSADTIPGGLSRKDRRVAAVATQPGPTSPDDAPQPEGHREGQPADANALREAGQHH